MGRRTPFFPLYAGDWLSCDKVLVMSAEEEGAYIHLLSVMWQNCDLALKDEPSILERLGRLVHTRWADSVLQSCFIAHPEKPGHITHKRLAEERAKQDEYHAKKRAASQKAVEARRAKEQRATSDEPVVNQPSTSGEPVVNQPSTLSMSMSMSESMSESSSEAMVMSGKISSPIGDSPPETSGGPAPIPYKELQALFNETCPSLKQSRVLSPKIKEQITARWKERKEHRDIEFWRHLFDLAEQQGFLRGENDRHWRAGLEFITKREKFYKVLDSDYLTEAPTLSRAGRVTKAAAEAWLSEDKE